MNQNVFSVESLTYLDNGPYSFSIEEHGVLGLTGRSGIGKTQLLRALVEAISSTGTKRLLKRESHQFNAPDWRRKVTFIPAESVWWYEYVGDHFPSSCSGSEIEKHMKAVGLKKEAFEWKVRNLSTGEKQRLALLRAMLLFPTVMLLDEPTSGLDERSSELVESLLLNYSRKPGKALIIVSHDMKQLKRMTKTIYRMTKKELLPIE